MMRYRARGGAEDLRPVTNSDILEFDHFMYVLRDNVYTQQAQEELFREKRSLADLRRFEPN